MSELNSRHRPKRADEIGDPPIVCYLPIVPYAGAFIRLSTAGFDGRFFPEHNSRTTKRQPPEVDQVPISRMPVVGSVLAHWRHDDPVSGSYPANR
jgi:hypothetical protein